MYMERNRLFFILTFLIILIGFNSCKEEYTAIDNVIYFAESQKTTSGKVVIDETGGTAKVTVRLAKSINSDIDVVVSEDAVALAKYNETFGTEYQLLPKDYYSLSIGGLSTDKTTLTTTIKAGEVAADFINIKIEPFDKKEGEDKVELSESVKYAIPMVIKSATGAVGLLESSSTYIVLVDRVVVTNVCYLNNTNYLEYKPEIPMLIEKWTFEWMVNMDAFNRNNVTQWSLPVPLDDRNGPMVYTRFGDVLTPQNQLQISVSNVTKQNSTTVFTPKKWYHIAITYDGVNVRLYVNGTLEFDIAHAVPGQTFLLHTLAFANPKNASYRLNGYCSELRFWSVSRTGAQIANNMYIVDPASEGLEIYWKCNDGAGKIIKDHSKYGRDAVLPTVPKWVSGQRFPDDK